MSLLDETARLAEAYLDSLPERRVGARAGAAELMAALGAPLGDEGVAPAEVVNGTALAAARHEVLRRAGWDVAADGLAGAPPIEIVVGAEAHVTVGAALKLLGFGARRVRVVDADEQGRMSARALAAALRD